MVGLREKLSNYIWVEPENDKIKQEIIAVVVTIEEYLNKNKPEGTEHTEQCFFYDDGAQVLFTYTKKGLLVYNVDIFIRFNTRQFDNFFLESRPQWTRISTKDRDFPNNTFTEHANALIEALIKDTVVGKYLTSQERYIELRTHVTVLDLKMTEISSFIRIKVHNGQVYVTE